MSKRAQALGREILELFAEAAATPTPFPEGVSEGFASLHRACRARKRARGECVFCARPAIFRPARLTSRGKPRPAKQLHYCEYHREKALERYINAKIRAAAFD